MSETSATERLLWALRQTRGSQLSDETVLELVRARLAVVSSQPEEIRAHTEHGCVLLLGRVATEERAHVVRAIASVRGVDSVVDLMTEEPSPDGSTPVRRWPLHVVRAEWRPLARIMGTGVGLGLAALGLSRRGLARGVLALGGALLAVRAATGLSVQRATRAA